MIVSSGYNDRGVFGVEERPVKEQIHANITWLMSAALTSRYNWHVALGREDGFRICLPTSPRGCLSLFKTRDRKAGAARRASLRHWVQHHWRSVSEIDLAYVRDHLRGATIFNWRGFNCEILVSAFDLEKNEFFKNQAAEWRSARKHNRVRVRIKEFRNRKE